MSEKPNSTARVPRPIADRPFFIFALIFCSVFLLHSTVLRLPYFWDEAGYFVPAARDFLLTGDLIPHTTLSNAHPPLVMVWLAMWWKFSNYTPAVTRTAMLLVSAFGLLGVYRLARYVANTHVAVASVILAALYPVWFAQSSLAHLDIPVAALTIWGMAMHIEGRRVWRIVFLSLAPLAKETAICAPLALFGWELLCPHLFRTREQWCLHRHRIWHTLSFLLCCIPLALWYAYHYHHTGFVLGNPEFLRYNLGATLSPVRVSIAFLQRLWQAFGYLNLFVLTIPALLAMRQPPVVDATAGERQRISIPVQIVLAVVVLAHVVEFAVLGGAVLARYMVPVIPLVIIVCVSTLYRRLQSWPTWIAIAAVAFMMALLINPPWRIAPEDNLSYTDFVHLHMQAATLIEQKYPNDKVLTAWPASDELNRPFLGYVKRPLTVIRVENFTPEQVIAASRQREAFDVAFVFSTKYEPPHNFLNHPRWPILARLWQRWEYIQERYFDYHRDLPPEVIAQILGGRIVWQRSSGGEWAAVIELDKIRNARVAFPELTTIVRPPFSLTYLGAAHPTN
jgi:hypothetical protein